MRFIFSLILICFFSINSGNALCAAAASSAGSTTPPTDAEFFETTGVRVVRKVPIKFLGESVEIETIDRPKSKAEEVSTADILQYINWEGCDKASVFLKNDNVLCRIFNKDSSLMEEHTFSLAGHISRLALSNKIPHGVIKLIKDGNKFNNHILDFRTGEMTLWFKGNVHYDRSSFTPDHTALYYIDTQDGKNWVFQHTIGKIERTPLYNLSTRHPDQTHTIDPMHIILHVDKETERVVYTNPKEISNPSVYISSKDHSGAFQLKGALISSYYSTTYYHSHHMAGKGLFYISNHSGADRLHWSQIDESGETNSTMFMDGCGTESTSFDLNFIPAMDRGSIAVKSRQEGDTNWKIIKFTGEDPSEDQRTYQALKDTQNIISLKGSRTISEIGPQRFPPTLVETDMISGNIIRVLRKPVLPRGLYYPPILSRTIPSCIDGREVHFLFNLPPLFSSETDQKRPFVLQLGGGPIVAPSTAEELRSTGIDLAQKGIGCLFINYRARYGRQKEDIESMRDEKGQWNDYHIWDVATVLHVLQDAGIATEFVLSGGSFDAHTVLALAHGQEPDTERFYGEDLNITGLVLKSGYYIPAVAGRLSKVTFENPKKKSIPTLALHGMHDWQCEFATQGKFIREYLKDNPLSLFIADPEAEHSLGGNPDIDTFMEDVLPSIMEKMALGSADPFKDFRESKLHQSFIDRYKAKDTVADITAEVEKNSSEESAGAASAAAAGAAAE